MPIPESEVIERGRYWLRWPYGNSSPLRFIVRRILRVEKPRKTDSKAIVVFNISPGDCYRYWPIETFAKQAERRIEDAAD